LRWKQNPACTYFESEYARNAGKKIILLRMIPWEARFEHMQGRVLFGMNHLALTWMRGAPMPITLTDAILAAVKDVGGQAAPESAGPRTTSGAAVVSAAEMIDMEAVSMATLQRIIAHPEMVAKLKDALKEEN
jgi:hypothetical protein